MSAAWEYGTSPVKQVTSTWDCLWSPIQCVKAAFGDEETSAKAYQEMRQPGSTQPQQQVTILPRSVQPITDSQVPFGPGCAPGWIYHEGLGTCVKELVKQTPKPQLYVTPGADGQPTVVQTTMSQSTNKAVLILATVLVGAAVFSLFRSR
jgi:hypothetical protein